MKSLKKRWRRFEVRFQRDKRVQSVFRWLIGSYLNFTFRTIRWEKLGFESYEADIARGIPRVLCCWHAHLAYTPYLRDWSDHKLTVMASLHADAQILTANVQKLGIGVIGLATSGDNSAAIRESVRALRNGGSLGITVDGPLGPPKVVKPGAFVIAGLAGVQAAPCTYAVSRSFRLPTWDEFIIPLPWSRGVLAVGDGFTPPKRMTEDEMQAATERLAGLINDLTEACEQRLKKR